jgi:hypothetical protein
MPTSRSCGGWPSIPAASASGRVGGWWRPASSRAAAGGARKLTLRVLGSNVRARRLYESCGFLVEGVLRAEFFLGGRYVDDVLMTRILIAD